MNLSLFFARRYLKPVKGFNVVNLISIISIAGISIGTMALVVVLSVFNGFEDLITSLYSSFDSDIRIESGEGKYFQLTDEQLKKVASLEGVAAMSRVVEENVMLKYDNKQFFATMKGVEESYLNGSGLHERVIDGQLVLQKNGVNYGSMGQGIAVALSFNLLNSDGFVSLYLPKKDASAADINTGQGLNVGRIMVSSVFALQQDVDIKYFLVPYDFARDMAGVDEQHYTAVELQLLPGVNAEKVKAGLSTMLGNKLIYKNKFEQHELLYKIIKSEKWAVFFILLFILIIASFNIVGAITMLIIEKRNHVATLQSIGANNFLLRNIFVWHGMLLVFIGTFSGLLTGLFVCWLQIRFGIISLGNSGTFIVDSYPVKVLWTDLAGTLATVLSIGALATLYATRGVERTFGRSLVSLLRNQG
jgi:lipoprotein-releasing system permease protein